MFTSDFVLVTGYVRFSDIMYSWYICLIFKNNRRNEQKYVGVCNEVPKTIIDNCLLCSKLVLYTSNSKFCWQNFFLYRHSSAVTDLSFERLYIRFMLYYGGKLYCNLSCNNFFLENSQILPFFSDGEVIRLLQILKGSAC
jgi:hypothetical protein